MHRLWVFFVCLFVSTVHAQSHFVTKFDNIPNLGLGATVQSVRDGDCADAQTWSTESVLDTADVVLIQHTITCATLHVKSVNFASGGKLQCPTDRLISWQFDTEIVGPGSTLWCETEHLTVLKIKPVKPYDPGQYTVGLLGVDGVVHLQGKQKTTGEVLLTKDVQAGDTSVTLQVIPVNWIPGDIVVLPDMRMLTQAESGNAFVPHQEIATIKSVTGNVVTFEKPVRYAHKAVVDQEGTVHRLPAVSMLTHTMQIVCDPLTPGHVFFTNRVQLHLRYFMVKDCGRTENAWLGSPGNIAGRYLLHLHHVYGAKQPDPSGFQWTVMDGALWHDVAVQHSKKWCATIHDSHFGRFERMTMFNCVGAGLALEDGNEAYNSIRHNMVVGTWGSSNRGDGLNEWGPCNSGDNYCLYGNYNWFDHNSGYNAMISGADNGYAFKLNHIVQPGHSGNWNVPIKRGNDTYTPGDFAPVNRWIVPFLSFKGNKGISGQGCLSYWRVGINWWYEQGQIHNPAAADYNHPKIIDDLQCYNMTLHVYPYESMNVHIKHSKFVNSGDWRNHAGLSRGYNGGDYMIRQSSVKDSVFSGLRMGIQQPTMMRPYWESYDTPFLFENVTLKLNGVDYVGRTNYASAHTAANLQDVHVIFKNSQLLSANKINVDYRVSSGAVNLIRKNRTQFVNFQGVEGDSFDYYTPMQAPGFVMPQTILVGTDSYTLVGCPEPGLTNTQCQQKHRAVMWGSIAPCTTTRPGLDGFACGAKPPPTPTPIALPATPRGLNVTFD